MNKLFRTDYGVFFCEHIFENSRPILLVIRDFDGHWQFLCDQGDDSEDGCHHVGVYHLIERDPSLAETANLEIGQGVERSNPTSPWKKFNLEEE